MGVVDTAGFPVVTVPRHAMPLPAIRQCATIGCTNEGPLLVPTCTPDMPTSDARCRSCVDSIAFLLDPHVAGGDPATLPEVRARVLALGWADLRGVVC